jgi:hypothetical protein
MYGTVQKKSHGPVEISRQERHQILKLHRNPSEIIVLLPNPGPFYRSAKTAAGRPGLWRWPAATSLVPTARHPAGHPARAYYVVGVRADSDPRRRRPPHRRTALPGPDILQRTRARRGSISASDRTTATATATARMIAGMWLAGLARRGAQPQSPELCL